MGVAPSVGTKEKGFSYKNWSTFTIDMNEIPISFKDLHSKNMGAEKEILKRNDLISKWLSCKENDIKVIANKKEFMWNFCTVQKGIEDKEDIFKKILEVNQLTTEVISLALEWKFFMEFWTAILDEELSGEGMNIVDQVFRDTQEAKKEVNRVKIDNDAIALLSAISKLRDWKDTLEHSPVLKKVSDYFQKSIMKFLFNKIEKHCMESREPKPMIEMTHYLNTVDEQYNSLVRERSQVINYKEIKRLRSKYWAVLKEKDKELELNLNMIYKESSMLITAMENKRFPNIHQLTLKRMERDEK
jgi:hypothetical protein